MRIEFHVTGADRKALVTAMGEILEARPKYLGMPTAAYEVDYFRIDKNGTVEFDDRADSGEIENLLDRLAERGFAGEGQEAATDAPKETAANDTAETDTAPQGENVGLTVAMPPESANIDNLKKLLEAKGSLIKKAFGIDELPVEVDGEKISFPWFSETDSGTARACTNFISALCKMSREQKRITATEKAVDNEKYAFRCFLLRLGFIGEEYKADRKILLKNLKGSSAFKSGAKRRQIQMKFPSKKIVERVRKKYSAGTRVELLKMDDCQAPPIGTKGTVTGVDDTASVMVAWDNGSHLHVIFGEDEIHRI